MTAIAKSCWVSARHSSGEPSSHAVGPMELKSNY